MNHISDTFNYVDRHYEVGLMNPLVPPKPNGMECNGPKRPLILVPNIIIVMHITLEPILYLDLEESLFVSVTNKLSPQLFRNGTISQSMKNWFLLVHADITVGIPQLEMPNVLICNETIVK